jgi:hypothetical protein
MDGFDSYREDYENMSADEIHEQYESLLSGRNQHPEYLIHQAWTALWRSFDVFTDNFTELRALLVAAESDANLQMELFQNVRPPTVRTAYFRALDRTLHNSLAGAVSLVDHTRRHVKEHFKDSAFSTEFEARNTAVYEMEESAFLRRFRNFLLHVGHAPFAMSGTLPTQGGESSTLTIWLIGDELLKAKDVWTGASRKFITERPEGIHLLEVVDAYGEAMIELYTWVFGQQPILRPDGLEILNEFTRRINLTMTAGAHDGRHMQQFYEHAAKNAQAAREGRPQTNWQDVKPSD